MVKNKKPRKPRKAKKAPVMDFQEKVKYYADMDAGVRKAELKKYKEDDKEDLIFAVNEYLAGLDLSAEKAEEPKEIKGLDLSAVKIKGTDKEAIADVEKQIMKIAEKESRGADLSKDDIRFMAKQIVNKEVKKQQDEERAQQRLAKEQKLSDAEIIEQERKKQVRKIAMERERKIAEANERKHELAKKRDAKKSKVNKEVLANLKTAQTALAEAEKGVGINQFSLRSYIRLAKKNTEIAIDRFF